MGPLMDVPCSDYVFVLVDNVIRIFSLGSSTQVAYTYTCTHTHTHTHTYTYTMAMDMDTYTMDMDTCALAHLAMHAADLACTHTHACNIYI